LPISAQAKSSMGPEFFSEKKKKEEGEMVPRAFSVGKLEGGKEGSISLFDALGKTLRFENALQGKRMACATSGDGEAAFLLPW